MEKTYFTEGDQPESQMGAALESLAPYDPCAQHGWP